MDFDKFDGCDELQPATVCKWTAKAVILHYSDEARRVVLILRVPGCEQGSQRVRHIPSCHLRDHSRLLAQ